MTAEAEVVSPADLVATFLLWPREKQEQWMRRVQESGDGYARCWQSDHEGTIAELRARLVDQEKRVAELERGIHAAVDAYVGEVGR